MTDDLLADVFDDTTHAPLPVPRRDAGGNLLRLWASPEDPRWDVDMTFYPDGALCSVRSVVPRERVSADALGASEPSTAVSGPGNGNGGER